MHPLLRRQLKRLGLDPATCPTDPAGWQAMLDRVSQSYVENDQGRALLEQSLDVTSREMQGLYEDLRRSGETELAEERNKLEAVLHSLGDGLCVVNTQWKIVLMNPLAEELLGAPLANLAGQPVYHFLSPGPEEFSHECLITDTSIPPLEQGIPFRTDDGILLRGDGQMMPISLVVTPISTDGVVNGAVLVFRNITAQKQAEEQRTESAALLRRVQAGLLELATNSDLYRGELSDAFHVITRVASQSLRVARASVWFFTDAHAAIRCADLFEQATETYSNGAELPATGFPRYFAELATEDVIVANQAQTDPKTSEFAASYLIPLGITSMLDVPIRSEGKMVGVICHEHIGPARVWTAEEQQFATSVANTISLVLETADRRKAEVETQRTKNFLNSVVEHLPIMLFVKEASELRFVRWNKAAEEVTGFDRSEMLGKCDHDFFPPGEADFFTAKDREVLASGTLLEIPEEQIHTKTRGTRILRTKKLSILDEAGKPQFLIGIAEDITERKQADEAIRRSEARTRLVIDSALDAVVTINDRGSIVEWNPRAEAIFGWSAAEACGRNLADTIIPLRFRAAHHTGIETFLRTGAGPILDQRIEVMALRRNGAEFPAELAVTALQIDAGFTFTAFIADISERKRAEAALQELSTFQKAMLDNAGHAIISTAPDGIIRLFNPAAESLLGYRADELIGKQTPAVFHDPEEVSARARLFSAELGVPIEPGFDVFVEKSRRGLPNEHEWTYIRKDGTRLTVLLNVTALRDTEGHITSFLGIASDITSLKIVERELITAKEAAEAASVAKSQFLANMSHEIRTPMNGVLGLAALLGQTSLSPKQQRLTNTIIRSGNSLLDIINDILDFSKIEAGKLELEHTDFHLRILVDDVLELFAAPAHQKHLELIADVADSVPAFVKGDPARLRQILINLIGNAIKFTAQGEVVVSIVSIAEGKDQSVLCFSVKDSGIGITPDALRNIFQPFAQADGSTTRKYGGTGLGLAIAKQLVAFMGGEIWAESQMGSGATFLFTVHLAHSHLGSTGALESKQALPNQRVLVVDDSPTARLTLDRQLRRWGATSTVAESGTAAVQLLANALEDGLPYDTVVLDLDMPGMNGLDTVRALRDTLQHHHPRVILMTPVERVDAAEDQTGLIAATLTKPVRPSDLYRALSGQTVQVSSSRHHPEQEERPPAKPQGSILLAEDNAVNQEVTLGMLEVLGCTATAVENGRQAIELLASQPFSVILMDCQMPEMDGFAATRTIRRQEQNTGTRIPIVALTAHALQGDRELCLAAGMDDYLSKPFTIEQLRTVIHRWLPSPSQPTQVDAAQASAAPPAAPASQTNESPVDPKSWDSITSLQRPGQPDLLAKVIGLYLKDSQGLVDKILAAAAGKDFASLRDTAHSLKSRSATLGAWHVTNLCKQLETGAREQTLAWTEAERLTKQLQQTFTATCEIFEGERQRRAA
ncbi:MAG: PAS domain S-box protein [Nitrospira sp.]|nr:PAS domain S-box protein [Nitrospira sp.]